MIYFDNAATSRYKPKEVIKAVEYEIKHAANPGRSGHDAALSAARRISDTRDSLIEYFNAPHHNAVFTNSDGDTDGAIKSAWGVDASDVGINVQ